MKPITMKHLPHVTLTLVVASVLIHLLAMDEMLQWSNGNSSASLMQFVRVWTSHLTHWSTQHLLWNALVLAGLGWMIEMQTRRGLFACVMLCCPAIIGLLHWTAIEPVIYRGLSGVDSGLFVLAAVLMIRRDWGQRIAMLPALALLLFAGKILYEFSTGRLLFVSSGDFLPSPEAHVAGGLVGLAVAVGDLLMRACNSSIVVAGVARRAAIGRPSA